MNVTCLLVSLLAVSLLGSPSDARADEGSPRPPTEIALEGAWVGVGETGIPVYRLTLAAGGKGLLASYDVRSPLLAWRVTSWSCKEGKVDLNFDAATQNTEAIRATGRAERLWMSDVLTLTTEVPGKTNSTERMVLRKEHEQARIVKEIQEWMQAYPSAERTNFTNGQPNGAANGSKPNRSETNRTSPEAGSRR